MEPRFLEDVLGSGRDTSGNGLRFPSEEPKMRRLILSAFMISALIASSVQAAVIHLKDGSRLQGTVVSATARSIQLHTPDGTLTISTDRIASIEFADADASAVRP